MKLLEMKDHNLHISDYLYSLKVFRDLWKRDRTRDKRIATSEIMYIYFMYDFRSDFLEQYPDTESRHEALLEHLGGLPKDWNPKDKKFLAAVDFYRKHMTSIKMKLVADVINSMHKLRIYFQDIDFNKTDDNGKPYYDISKYNNAIKSLNQNFDSLDKIKISAMKDVKEMEARGGIEKGIFEDGIE